LQASRGIHDIKLNKPEGELNQENIKLPYRELVGALNYNTWLLPRDQTYQLRL